jgi:hypothetical protein
MQLGDLIGIDTIRVFVRVFVRTLGQRRLKPEKTLADLDAEPRASFSIFDREACDQ